MLYFTRDRETIESLLNKIKRFMPRILLLIPTTTYRASAFLEAAARLRLEVVVASDESQALAPLTPGSTLALDFQDPCKAVAKVVKMAQESPFQAVIGIDDKTVILAAMANEALSLAHNSVESAQATRNKYLMRKALQFSNIPSPHFELLTIDENPLEWAKRLKYPCVLKPTFLSASRGVIRANNSTEFTLAFHQIVALLSNPEIEQESGTLFHLETVREILVEEYIPGKEVSLEGLLTKGELKILALFDKPDPLEGPFFVETLYVTPSRLPENIQQQIAHVTQQAIRALGLREGPVHAELRYDGERVWPIEIAARSIGGLCSRVLEFSRNLSLEELILLHALGQEVQTVQRHHQAAGVLMLPVPEQGILQGVTGLEEAREIPGIEDVLISIPAGQPVEPVPYGSRYLGFIFSRAPSPQSVEHALRAAYNCLRVEITTS